MDGLALPVMCAYRGLEAEFIGDKRIVKMVVVEGR